MTSFDVTGSSRSNSAKVSPSALTTEPLKELRNIKHRDRDVTALSAQHKTSGDARCAQYPVLRHLRVLPSDCMKHNLHNSYFMRFETLRELLFRDEK